MVSEIEWSVLPWEMDSRLQEDDWCIEARLGRCRVQRILTAFEVTRVRYPGYVFWEAVRMQKRLLEEVFVTGRKRR